ncbi:MAG: alkaline phosphatase family protein, partial [Solirubrobacteraceae bacterium]
AYYLSDYDYSSHVHGPAGADDVSLERIDAALQTLLDAAGGGDAFLERYAVVLVSDHGQTHVDRGARLEVPLARFADEIVLCASNRAAQVYIQPGVRTDAAELARALDGEPSVDVTLRFDGDRVIARCDGADGSPGELEHPDAVERSRAALANPNAGELLVSAAEGWEFADLGGRHHAGGGSHGSLVAGDSYVPLLTIGIDAPISRITEITPAVLSHFGVGVTADAR